MTIAQMFQSACELSDEMPKRVAEFIEIDKDLKRRFREDSMTDVLLASFLKLPPDQVRLDTPREAITGSDFDLFVTQRANTDMTHYRIQAKRLCDQPHWTRGYYKSLAHRLASTNNLQVDILCDNLPTACMPLYAFYNHANVVSQSNGQVHGISLANAFGIRRCIHRIVSGSTEYKRVGKLAPLFFPFRTILCPPDGSGRAMATPEESRRAAQEAIAATAEHWPAELDDEQQEMFRQAFHRRTRTEASRAQGPEGVTQYELRGVARRLREPTPAQVRADVLEAVNSDRPGIRSFPLRRPRVILIGPADADTVKTRQGQQLPERER
jgi:hypothetical protein